MNECKRVMGDTLEKKKTAVAGRLPQISFWQEMSVSVKCARRTGPPVTDREHQALGASAAAGASGAVVVT